MSSSRRLVLALIPSAATATRALLAGADERKIKGRALYRLVQRLGLPQQLHNLSDWLVCQCTL